MVIQKILTEIIIPRAWYLDKIKQYLGTPLIKVLIGQRRVGKSSILKSLLQDFIHTNMVAVDDIFYINKELPIFDDITTYDNLKQAWQFFISGYHKGKIVVAIDEIQEIRGREKFINGLLAEYGATIEIFITGSNAFLLSGDLSTHLTGRYQEFEIYPLSFTEFCIFGQTNKTKEVFLDYLKYGGLPAIFQMNYKEEVIFPYLLGVYNTIVIKDIMSHYVIKNIGFFRDLYKYTLTNIGSIISGKSITDYLKSQKIAIGTETVLNFLGYATDTFLLHKVYSLDPHTKKYFEIYNKYYVGDLGLRNALVGYDMKRDIGKLIENYVFLELKRHGYQIKIGRFTSTKQEIDFIAEKQGIIKYFQVCYLLGSEETMLREYSALESIKDNRPKYIVSFDDINHGIHNGIEHISVMSIDEIL